MNYFINEIGEVFAFELGVITSDDFRVISETEAMALAAGPRPVFDLVVVERAWRDDELLSVTWLRDRHRDQIENEVATTLSDGYFKQLLVYIQTLRDWPQSPNFPKAELRPVAPSWLAEQTE